MIVISVLILNFYFIRSLIVMVPYNFYNFQKSFIDDENLKVDIPKEENLNWYPLMNKFNAENFKRYINKDVDLFIYYTYGNFENKYSDIFRESSPTYSSFYGCYIVKNNSFDDYIYDKYGELIIKDIKDLMIYDYEYLVLRPLGYGGEVDVDFEIINKNIIDKKHNLMVEIEMNGLGHSYRDFKINYIQYGTPDNLTTKNFKRVHTYGKFIIEKFKDDIYLVYYIINRNYEIVNEWGN
jgi:hypothetical protein